MFSGGLEEWLGYSCLIPLANGSMATFRFSSKIKNFSSKVKTGREKKKVSSIEF